MSLNIDHMSELFKAIGEPTRLRILVLLGRGDLTVSDLVRQQQLTPERVAIEYNRLILARSRWSDTLLKPEDQLEIVHFVGGG